jgi:hypothetical protein
MKQIIDEQDTQFNDGERVEPFDSIMDIVSDYGPLSVIEAVQNFSVFVAEEHDTCPACGDEASWLALALAKYARRFPSNKPEINHPGFSECAVIYTSGDR